MNGHGESQIEGEDVGNLSCGNRGENVARGTGEFGVVTFCRGGQHGRSDGDDDVTSNNGECLEFFKLLLVAPGDRFSIKGLVNFHVEGMGWVNLNFGAKGWSTGGVQEGNDGLELGRITEGEGVVMGAPLTRVRWWTPSSGSSSSTGSSVSLPPCTHGWWEQAQ